jgi:site-specific recombinase XerD
MMSFKQNLSLLFWLYRSKAGKDGKAPIYARITISGRNTDIAIGKKVLPANWNNATKQVKGSSSEAKLNNQEIDHIKANLNKLFLILQQQHGSVSPLMLKAAYLNKGSGLNPDTGQRRTATTLLQAFAVFTEKFELQVSRGIRADGTLRQWRTTTRKVLAFIKKHYRTTDLLFTDVDFSFAEKFYDFLTLEVEHPLSDITAKKHVKKVRQILKAGVRTKQIPNNPLDGFNCSGDEKEVHPLEFQQVEMIYSKEISIPRLEEVRDAFIFQCFTGFAYQDIYNLSPDHIVHVGLNGERWLIKERGKTSVTELVPILPVVEELIRKYKNNNYYKINNRLIPVNSNYRYSVYLKELAEICGIKKELNTHLARHTFADIMLNNGIPLEDVSKMLGHKSIRSTQRYAKVRKERISRSMANVRTRLFHEDGSLKIL